MLKTPSRRLQRSLARPRLQTLEYERVVFTTEATASQLVRAAEPQPRWHLARGLGGHGLPYRAHEVLQQ
eukprot:7391579-Prymnesium_polylepis.3